jgi:hypothetical protein
MDGLHIWPRNSHMMMALANLDGSMTGTLYMDTTGGRYVLILTTTFFFCCVFIPPFCCVFSYFVAQYILRRGEGQRVRAEVLRHVLQRGMYAD